MISEMALQEAWRGPGGSVGEDSSDGRVGVEMFHDR